MSAKSLRVFLQDHMHSCKNVYPWFQPKEQEKTSQGGHMWEQADMNTQFQD